MSERNSTIIYPDQTVVTTVTVPSSENPPTSSDPDVTYVQLRPGYFRTFAGILKLIQVILAVITMACASPAWRPGTSWFLFVVVICFIITLVWIFVYLLSLTDNLRIGISWVSVEFGYTLIAAVLYFTAFIVQLSIWSPNDRYSYLRSSNLASGSFACFNFIAYALGTLLLFFDIKKQG